MTFAPVAPDPLDEVAVGALAPTALFDLTGRVAIVTGAAGEIGGWLAAGLGSAGARLVVTDVAEPGLEAAARLLGGAGLECLSVAADLAETKSGDEVVAAALRRFGRVDVLVNCAAVNRREPILDVTPENYDRIVAVDLRAPYFLAQAAARAMIDARRGGSIVNIGSINVAVGLQDVSVYGHAKAALAQLTKVMAVEWTAYGIRANCLAPGMMLTRLSAAVWDDEHRAAWMLDRIPARRPGLPRELVGLCLLLASDAGSYLNGQTIFVDGGFLAGSPWNAESVEHEPEP